MIVKKCKYCIIVVNKFYLLRKGVNLMSASASNYVYVIKESKELKEKLEKSVIDEKFLKACQDAINKFQLKSNK